MFTHAPNMSTNIRESLQSLSKRSVLHGTNQPHQQVLAHNCMSHCSLDLSDCFSVALCSLHVNSCKRSRCHRVNITPLLLMLQTSVQPLAAVEVFSAVFTPGECFHSHNPDYSPCVERGYTTCGYFVARGPNPALLPSLSG